MTTSSFLSVWADEVIPNLISSWLYVTATFVGLSMLIGLSIMAIRRS